ncbi:hypothetical protein ACFUJY_29385 [Streptomyces sp. NPDC057249]|uniref:hypothetical protein n=1 Tax=Streptomyces sp. NPDC057249 TaxID=3346067 RepID=UPI00363F884D
MVELVEADIQQFYQGRRRMPYIAPWSEEHPDRSLTWLSGGRLAYTDEVQQDRVRGALLLRYPSARGRGDASPAGVHPQRQREVMDRLGCQVCGADTHREAAEQWNGRRLFLAREGTSLQDGAQTASPPVHRACAIESMTESIGCKRLGRHPVLALVEQVTPWGVHGLVHDPVTRTPIGERRVPYGDPMLPATIAFRVIVQLHGCAPIAPDDLRAAA